MTGIFKLSLPGEDRMSASETIAAAAALGVGGCLFPNVLDISATLDLAELRAALAVAKEEGIGLAAGAGWINPFHLERAARLQALGDGDYLAGLARLVAAAAEIGIHDLFFMISLIEDRFDRTVPWSDQLEATTALLSRFAPVLRQHGSRLLLKTHEEITTFEIVRVVEAVGPDVLGVALDPVNLLVRIEDPVAATRRVQPYVHQVHLDDAQVRFAEQGIRRVLYPFGQGQIDWQTILAMVPEAPRWIETHRGRFAMPVFDRDWLTAQPDMPLTEFAAVMAMAAHAGTGPIPWDQATPSTRLAPTLEAVLHLDF